MLIMQANEMYSSLVKDQLPLKHALHRCLPVMPTGHEGLVIPGAMLRVPSAPPVGDL